MVVYKSKALHPVADVSGSTDQMLASIVARIAELDKRVKSLEIAEERRDDDRAGEDHETQ